MNKTAMVLLALFLLTACTANREQGSQGTKGTSNVANKIRDTGLKVEALHTADRMSYKAAVPSEPDMDREVKVIQLVTDSEKYIGKKMDESKFVEHVFNKLGYKDVLHDVPPHDGQDLFSKIQPGDILYFDLNGDGKIDHHAIKLGNGEMIHSYTGGKVTLTDILKEPQWKKKLAHVQRVF